MEAGAADGGKSEHGPGWLECRPPGVWLNRPHPGAFSPHSEPTSSRVGLARIPPLCTPSYSSPFPSLTPFAPASPDGRHLPPLPCRPLPAVFLYSFQYITISRYVGGTSWRPPSFTFTPGLPMPAILEPYSDVLVQVTISSTLLIEVCTSILYPPSLILSIDSLPSHPSPARTIVFASFSMKAARRLRPSSPTMEVLHIRLATLIVLTTLLYLRTTISTLRTLRRLDLLRHPCLSTSSWTLPVPLSTTLHLSSSNMTKTFARTRSRLVGHHRHWTSGWP
ncbi:hypothetical protein C8T65DRAFT_50578 [Cerioporus squamosus]|nr:hypothetical protein C8T65DRAFT_50578 [Cerioporus squamosus]